jgi:peptidoglycan/xylan/chitin deacetylase (PgdA/CDA1 family)
MAAGAVLAAPAVAAPAVAPVAPAQPPVQRPAHPPAQPVRYRLVGCVRSGPAVAYSHGPRRMVVALTFDDGPWSDTPAFVAMLEREHVPATFFLIGSQTTSTYRSTLHRELLDGDALGDHTFTHPYLTRTGDTTSQLTKTIGAIRAQTGYAPCVFRPPYGAYDASVVRDAASLGLATILWDVDPSDYTLPGVAAIAARVLAQVQPGSIVISHDGGGPRGQTLAAYPHIIHVLRARGYRFETVPQMLGFRAVYRRCVKLCEDLGVKGPLPRGAIVENRP